MNSDGGKVTRYSQDGRAFDGPRERYLLCGTRLEVYILFLLFWERGGHFMRVMTYDLDDYTWLAWFRI